MSFANAFICLVLSWLVFQHRAINEMHGKINRYESLVEKLNHTVISTLDGYNSTLESLASGIDTLQKVAGDNVAQIEFMTKQLEGIHVRMAAYENTIDA